MMGWGGYGGMMGGVGVFGTILMIVILADLVFLGIWLWKQINKR